MLEQVIEVKNLVKKYGRLTAVDSITFSVSKGEIFGLLGPNGAGKSTTLEIVETLREKTSGNVTVCGYSLDTEPASIKKIIGVHMNLIDIVNQDHLNPLVCDENLDFESILYRFR